MKFIHHGMLSKFRNNFFFVKRQKFSTIYSETRTYTWDYFCDIFIEHLCMPLVQTHRAINLKRKKIDLYQNKGHYCLHCSAAAATANGGGGDGVACQNLWRLCVF